MKTLSDYELCEKIKNINDDNYKEVIIYINKYNIKNVSKLFNWNKKYLENNKQSIFFDILLLYLPPKLVINKLNLKLVKNSWYEKHFHELIQKHKYLFKKFKIMHNYNYYYKINNNIYSDITNIVYINYIQYLKYGFNIILDSNITQDFMYAIKHNNIDVINYLLENYKKYLNYNI